ncbi:ankyrin-3-like [Battus philenor]|uniref:ankyrin-3-like n=1 Tax=Battus philenor TaxID=42288 RepID=UPI0035CEE4F1
MTSAQIIDSELTAKLLGRGVAVSPVVTVEPRRRKFHKAITLSMPAPRPHTQGMTNQYSTSSAPTLRLLCSISGGTNRAHWEDVTENTPLTFVNDCVSFTTTVSARYWLIDCRHIEDATKMATELYREAIHVPFMARFVVYAKRTDECQAQLRMFCVTDDKEEKALERIERFIQVAKSRDVEVHEGKPVYLEFGGNLVPVAKSGEQLSIPFRAFRENRVAFPVMIKTQDLEPICRCQFMRDPKVPKGEPSPSPIAVLNIMVPDDIPAERISPVQTDAVPRRTEEQEMIWRQRLGDPRLEDICNLLGKDWVALAYELGVSVATVNQIQAKRITTAEQAQLMLKLWKTQSGTKALDNSLELALCRIGRDDIIAPQSEITNERRIQRNIYQERQASEEIEAYKAEEDNKLKDKIYDDNQIAERIRESELDQDEAKYSPEEKSIVDKSEVERTPSPSEDSEDEDVKRSVAERKEQITKKLSSSKIPASKQKKEIREEIIEIKTQIKPDIKKFQDIEQQVKDKEPKLERTRSKMSPDTVEEQKDEENLKESVETVVEKVKIERSVEQFRKFDPSSPAKPTPKHLQRHMRNESMRFPSGDFSNVTITPKKSITVETVEIKPAIDVKMTSDSFAKEIISQKEKDSARVEEKLDDGDKSPELVIDAEKDIAEATLRDKISSFESKILKEPPLDTTKTVKLTKEALKKHTLEQDQSIEYTQEFVREQSKQLSSAETHEQVSQKIIFETERHVETVKSVKETIQHFDSRTKHEEKIKPFPKAMRTDSTLVQVSSEEDSEFLKKSTDSETETESQTTIKLEKDKIKSKIGIDKQHLERKSDDVRDKHDGKLEKDQDKDDSKKPDDDEDNKKDSKAVSIKMKMEKQLTQELRSKVSEEEITEDIEQKEVSVETQHSVASTKSDISKHTKTDSIGSEVHDLIGHKTSQDSPVQSGIEKTDSLIDLQQSTEKDVSFISQTESKVYSKHRSDSLDEASQFSDLEEQIGTSPAHRPITDRELTDISSSKFEDKVLSISVAEIAEAGNKERTIEFLTSEREFSTRSQSSSTVPKEMEKITTIKESPVISSKARQFIETVPEDDSVQECFFSKRIYSDSLEDSEHTDSRRHSEAESLKSDQSDMKAKISSSDFDERAEYEETGDSGSGFGDEKFEESVGFTAIKIDPKALERDKQDSDSDKVEETDVVFKKVIPKRHSRTESISITKLSDLQLDVDLSKPKQEFQMIVTEAEEMVKSFDKDETSDKISSESSRDVEISDRKSSEGISDRITSEDAVTDKKTSSDEDAAKEGEKLLEQDSKIYTESPKIVEKKEVKTDIPREDVIDKVVEKRQSVTSAGSGSVSELRLEEKRLSDAHSLTESRDYTFEESEDDIATQGTHVDIVKDKDMDVKIESIAKPSETSKAPKLTHGDSLDDVEGFPEDHTEYIHKLPHISETGSATDKRIEKEVTKVVEPVKKVPIHPETEDVTQVKCTTSTTVTKHTEIKSTDFKFDVSKIRTDTLGKFEFSSEGKDAADERDSTTEKVTIVERKGITKEEVKPVIDDILQKGSVVAAARSPTVEKDVKTITKEVVESEKRSFDAKVPQKEERRHSCISPALSLERIAESEIEMEDESPKPSREFNIGDTDKMGLKKSDSAMKQMADNIEIIIKQASEDVDLSVEEPISEVLDSGKQETQDLKDKVSVDSIIEEAVTTVEGYLESTHEKTEKDEIVTKDITEESKRVMKERPNLMKSLSRDSGEIVIMPKKKQTRTFSVQSSPEEVEEQIYTDSESDMDKAKVLEIIEPGFEADGKLPSSSFDTKKLRTDSLDDADDIPEKESEYFAEEDKRIEPEVETFNLIKAESEFDVAATSTPCGSSTHFTEEGKLSEKVFKKTQFVDSIMRSEIVSKSTTESSVTTVISTLTKSSEDEQKSVVEDATSADFSKISGADLVKDPSKTSLEAKEEFKLEENADERVYTPDLSKKSIDLTKDYSKSSIDSKDTSRDFATNELSKDSTADLTKDFSKASIESVKETSKSIDEKTFSEDHSSFDVSRTLASDASDGITVSKEFLEEERSVSRVIKISTSSSQGTSVLTESKVLSEQESLEKTKLQDKTDVVQESDQEADERTDQPKIKTHKDFEICREIDSISKIDKSYDTKELLEEADTKSLDNKTSTKEENITDMTELNRRCSNLLEDISAQGALIRIDSTHVTHELASKFSKTPPPSPVDLILKDKAKVDDGTGDKQTGMHLKGSETSYLDASRQSPRASSAGDSLLSETEAHQSEILTEASKALSEAARPKSPIKHLADNLSFVNVDQPTITSGAMELVERTIEKSIDVIDQIKKEQQAVKLEDMQKLLPSDNFYTKSIIETSTSSSSIHKTIEGTELKFQNIDPDAVMSDMVAKLGTSQEEFSTILTHKETETRKISGQEFFTETKHVSSSDDDSVVIKTETTHELRGQEHELKEKSVVRKEGDQTETSEKKLEKAHEASAKRSDVETKTVSKSSDDVDIVKVEREFTEQGLYSGRQTKSEEKMTAIKDETVKKKQEVKISEREMSHEQWGKEYFTEPGELEDIQESEDKPRIAFVDSALKIIEKDEVVSTTEISEKGKVVSTKVEHHKEESVIESKEHDDLSSDASHAPSFKSDSADKKDTSELSPKSRSKSFKKDNEVYEVDFIKEIKVSTSPVKSSFSRTGSQDTHSESEIVPDLPHDDKTGETPKKDKVGKTPVKLQESQIQDQILEVSLRKVDSFVMGDIEPHYIELKQVEESSVFETSVKSDITIEIKPTEEVESEVLIKSVKMDLLPNLIEAEKTEWEDSATTSKDLMIKSSESVDTEYMVKSLESHEGEILHKSMDSTVSAETLQPSDFSTEADSAFLTGTDQRKEEVKLVKEKSLEDICSSGYDTDFSSAEFHALKLETEKVDFDTLMSAQPLADLSVLEKTIDEVKQSLEAAQVEIISEKSDGSIKYKQSPSEFQFKILISPERPEVITEEPHHTDEHLHKLVATIEKEDTILESQQSDTLSQKISSQEETTTSEEEKDTVLIKEPSPPLDTGDLSIKSDSGPHSILETESEIGFSDRDSSSKGSPEVKLRVHKHISSKLGVAERRSASELEGWSSSGESHYQSFEHSESRPLSSDIEVMLTAQSGTEFDTALTSHDVSSQSLRTSKDYFTAGSSLASRDSMKSLDSDGSSQVASIDISDASETLVPSANELKEELMESSTYVEQFLHETEKEQVPRSKEISDDDISGDEENKVDNVEPVGKMKRSHEMRFQPKDMIPEHFPLDGTSESVEFDDDSFKDKEGSDTTISSQLKTDEILSSSISKLDTSSSQSQQEIEKEETIEQVIKGSSKKLEAIPFTVTKFDKPQRELVDVDSQIIPVGSSEYEDITKFGSIMADKRENIVEDSVHKTLIQLDESLPKEMEVRHEITETCIKKIVEDVSAIPFPIVERPPSQREFVDIDSEIITSGTKQYEEISKSKSDSSVPKTKAEKSSGMTSECQLESKQSSSSSLKTHEHISTPHTPLSAPSQSSLSTENGREYVLDDIYDISETPELKSDLATESSRSELVVTTEDKTVRTYEKEQESPTSDEFEMVDKPSEMDDFVVIEEVAKEAQETDPEGKSVRIVAQKYIKRHDVEVEEYLSKTSKKQDSSSASESLSDEELLQYEIEQKKLQAQELAEIEAGKRWIQMQFEGDPRYDYERIPLEDIKEEEMTDFDASRIGSLSSQKESIGSYGSFRNSYGSLSESEMASRIRFRVRGENDDISISSLQEFENLERALMEQYQQHSSSSQDSLNGSLPRRYILSKSQGDDISVSSLKEFEGLESACLEALKAEILAKQKEALLHADPKVATGSFLEQEKRSYSSSSESSPPLKSGSPGQKSGSPSQKGGSPSQKVGSYGSPSQRLLADSAAIRKLIDQQMALEQRIQEHVTPKIVTVKKYDDRGAFFVPEPEPETSDDKKKETDEECKKTSAFTCAAAPSDGSAESIPGDCEEMMKILDQEEKTKRQQQQLQAISRTFSGSGGVIEVVRTTTVIQQRFVDGKKVSETVSSTDSDGAVDIPTRLTQYDDSCMSLGSEMSSSLASQPSEMDSLMTVMERQSDGEVVTVTQQTIITSTDKPEDLDFSREGSAIRELSPSSGRSVAHSVTSFSGKHFTDPASGSWSCQDEELSSSGSFSRGARADLMLGSTDSLEATSSNATRATFNYEIDTPMTGSLTSGAVRPPGSNTMVSSLDTMDPITAVQIESMEYQSSEQHSHDYEVQEPDTEKLDADGRVPKAKERTIMFDSTDTLSAVSGDSSVREATVEAPAPTFYIGDTPILRGEKRDDDGPQPTLSGSCPASLPPTTHPSPPIPAQRRSLTMIAKAPQTSLEEVAKK